MSSLPSYEPRSMLYHGLPVSAEASMTREDAQDWYTVFFEEAYCVPHRDGKHIIVCWPHLSRDSRVTKGWPVIKVRTVYDKLGAEHPRIIRHTGDLEDGSLMLERVFPGPFDLTLPTMNVPVPSVQNTSDKLMLNLYYRWALQGLSALSVLHSNKIYLRTFSSQQIWLRSDFSLALTGFVGADITGDRTDYGEGGRVHNEVMEFDEDALHGCVAEDIFYWATFVWRLMTNDYTDQSPSAKTYCWEPCCPTKGDCKPYDENRDVLDERYLNGMWQELEEARLGSVLMKAWKRKYASADEIAGEVRSIAERMDIKVDEDEVEVERKWEDVFEVIETGPRPQARRLEFKQ